MATDIQPTASTPRYTLWQMILYMLRLGTLGFGGPVALVGYMYRDLVERRGWITEADYKEGLALSELAPGPLAAQLAIYLGYVHYRIVGATLVGIAFVLPSFIMVVALGWAYTNYGGLPWMQAVFYGVGAAVLYFVAQIVGCVAGALIAHAMILMQFSVAQEPKVDEFRKLLASTLAEKHESVSLS